MDVPKGKIIIEQNCQLFSQDKDHTYFKRWLQAAGLGVSSCGVNGYLRQWQGQCSFKPLRRWYSYSIAPAATLAGEIRKPPAIAMPRGPAPDVRCYAALVRGADGSAPEHPVAAMDSISRCTRPATPSPMMLSFSMSRSVAASGQSSALSAQASSASPVAGSHLRVKLAKGSVTVWTPSAGSKDMCVLKPLIQGIQDAGSCFVPKLTR